MFDASFECSASTFSRIDRVQCQFGVNSGEGQIRGRDTSRQLYESYLMKLKSLVLFSAIAYLLTGCGSNSDDASSATVPVSVDPKSIPIAFKNTTRGVWADDQIYLEVVGFDGPGGDVNYVKPGASTRDGSVGIVRVGTTTDNNASDCLHNGSDCYPNYAFRLSDLKQGTLILPGNARYAGARIYMSFGKPLYMKVADGNKGIVQVNFDSPTDINTDTVFDWFEFAYDPYNKDAAGLPAPVAFGGNETMVDQFAVPIDFEVTTSTGNVIRRGVTLGSGSSSGAATRDALIENYQTSTSAPFQALVQRGSSGTVTRIKSPFHSADFLPGGTNANYFDSYMQAVWSYYKTTTLVHYDQPGEVGNKWVGNVVANASGVDVLRFTYTDAGTGKVSGPYEMTIPTTQELLEQNKAFPSGTTPAEIAMFRDLTAAVLRHVALDPTTWFDSAAYYQTAPYHEYSKFMHDISIDHKAYGFGYDDVADQSSVIILPGGQDAKSMTINMYW